MVNIKLEYLINRNTNIKQQYLKPFICVQIMNNIK